MEAVSQEGCEVIEVVCYIPQVAFVCSDNRYEGLAAQIDSLTREVQSLRNVVQLQGNLIANLIRQFSTQTSALGYNIEGNINEYRPQITAFFDVMKQAQGNTQQEKLQDAVHQLYQEDKLMNIVLCVMFTLVSDLPAMTGDFISEFKSVFQNWVEKAQREASQDVWGASLPKPYELPSFMREFYEVYMEYRSVFAQEEATPEQIFHACSVHEICNDLFEQETPESLGLQAQKA